MPRNRSLQTSKVPLERKAQGTQLIHERCNRVKLLQNCWNLTTPWSQLEVKVARTSLIQGVRPFINIEPLSNINQRLLNRI